LTHPVNDDLIENLAFDFQGLPSGLSNKSKFETRRRKERKGMKENDKKNPFISLLCAFAPLL